MSLVTFPRTHAHTQTLACIEYFNAVLWMCYRQRVDAEHGNADGKVTQCSIAPHFVSCDAEAEDASDSALATMSA